jgi:hypothetical protein
MENTNWFKQTPNKPLFDDLLWSKPENRLHAGKLLIIGGNLHAVTAPGMAYSSAVSAGAGTVRVLLPDATRKMIGKVFPEAEFAPSTPSGSFGRKALDQLLESASWADGVLLAGDFGHNSETAILLDGFASKFVGQLTVAQDGMDYFLNKDSLLFRRPDTTAVISFSKLQKLAQNNRPQPPIRHSMNLRQLVELMNDWTAKTLIRVITNHADQFIAASDGKVSTTPMNKGQSWQVELGAYASVWLMQQPTKPFEALTTAVACYNQ